MVFLENLVVISTYQLTFIAYGMLFGRLVEDFLFGEEMFLDSSTEKVLVMYLLALTIAPSVGVFRLTSY